MKHFIFMVAFACCTSWAHGKVRVLNTQESSNGVTVWKCQLMYNDRSLTVGHAMQLLETNPSLAKRLKAHLGIESGKMDEILIQKAVAHQKKKQHMIGDCFQATLNDLFKDVAAMESCSKLEKLAEEMNKIPIAKENINFSDRCNAEEAPVKKLSSSPGAS